MPEVIFSPNIFWVVLLACSPRHSRVRFRQLRETSHKFAHGVFRLDRGLVFCALHKTIIMWVFVLYSFLLVFHILPRKMGMRLKESAPVLHWGQVMLQFFFASWFQCTRTLWFFFFFFFFFFLLDSTKQELGSRIAYLALNKTIYDFI